MKQITYAALIVPFFLFALFSAYPASAQPSPTTDSSGGASASESTSASASSKQAPAVRTGDISTNISFWSDPLDWIMQELLKLFGWLLAAASVLLDQAVLYTVVTAGQYIQGLSAINVAWTVLRDVGNIILVFGFLAVGISTIFNADFYGGGTKILPKLLIAAVLLNFSLFIASAIVDTGNLFATQFYKAISGPTAVGAQGLDQHSGVTGHIMNTLGLSTLYDLGTGTQIDPSLVGFLGIVLVLIATLVIGSLAFMLIARFVILILLLITSPIGFVAFAVPKFEGVGRQWLEQLINQTLTAPVMLLLLYVALKVITDPFFLSGAGVGAGDQQGIGTWGAAINAQGTNGIFSFGSLLLTFLVAMGLLLAVLYFAKQLSAFGSGQIIDRTGQALSFPFRAAGAFGTGWAGKRLQKFNTNMRSRRAGRVVGGVLSAATLGTLSDYNVSKAAKGMQQVKFGTSSSYAERQDFNKSREVELNSVRRKREAEEGIDRAIQEVNDGIITRDVADHRIAQSLALLSDKEISELEGIKKGTETLVRNLSPQQFKSIMDNKEVTDKQKSAIKAGRFADVRSAVAAASRTGASAADIEAGQKAIARLNNKELGFVGDDFFADAFVADNLTDDQVEYLGKEGVISPVQKTSLETARKNRFDVSKTGAPGVAANIKALKNNRDKIRKVPPNVLTDRLVLDALGNDALDVIDAIRGANLSVTDRQNLGTYFEGVATSPTDPRSAAFLAYLTSDPRVRRDLLIP